MYVRMAVCLSATFRRKHELRSAFFLVVIPFIYDHPFCIYFVCKSVSQATKDFNVKTKKRKFESEQLAYIL